MARPLLIRCRLISLTVDGHMDAYNMIRDIREQPKNFADILQMRSRIVDITRAISEQNPPRGYYTVGCGSSYYSAMVGAFTMNTCLV